MLRAGKDNMDIQLTEVRKLFEDPAQFSGKKVSVGGWVRSNRDSKKIGFLTLSDGSCFRQLQIVYGDTLESGAAAEETEAAKESGDRALNFAEVAKLNISAAVIATGTIVLTPEAKQPFEMQAEEIYLEGDSTPDYPLQKKRHTLEYLRTMPGLRARTNTFQAVFRVRSVIAYAIHRFFQENGFVYVHTQLITSSRRNVPGDDAPARGRTENGGREGRLFEGFLRQGDEPYRFRAAER